MKPLTGEWVEKAEEDYAMVRRELRARKDPSYSGACFHAQQCVEKCDPKSPTASTASSHTSHATACRT
ncbi:MAG: HEPN domain-containing protein [Phycisphaerae bacterium]